MPMNRSEYETYEASCRKEVDANQSAIAEFTLFATQIQFPEARLVVFDQSEPIAEAELTLLGSWGTKSGTWMWGWANPALDDAHRARAAALRDLADETANDEFTSKEPFEIAEPRAWGVAAVGSRHLGARGISRESANARYWFFAVGDVRPTDAAGSLEERAQTALHEAILTRRWAPVESPDDLMQYLRVRDPRGLQTRTVSNEARAVNMVRQRFPEIRLSLMNEDLRGAPLPWTNDLHVQLLRDIGSPTHRYRDLVGANFSHARLDGANLRGVLLSDASFDGASLVDADLTNADLNGVSFRDAFLNGTNFTRAAMTGADFTGAELSRTLLTSVDLSQVAGLEETRHTTPSEISFSTLLASRFQVTANFLRKAGVSRGLLEDLAAGQRFPGSFQTCFLSYSSKDAAFAKKLYESLTEAGVRVFWDRFDVVPGERLEDQIAEAIRELDRLLVVISPNSIASEWVKKEVEMAWRQRRDSLLPIRLCPIEAIEKWTAADQDMPDLGAEFPIQDFSEWQDGAAYEHALSMLLKAFTGGVAVEPR